MKPCLKIAIVLGLLGTASNSDARVYKAFDVNTPVVAQGGGDRDLIAFVPDIRTMPSGNAAITLTPVGQQPLTMIIYEGGGRQVARGTSANGEPITVVFPFPRTNTGKLFSVFQQFVIRVVPKDGAYDLPQTAEFYEKPLVSFSNRAMLGAYHLEVRDADPNAVSSPPADKLQLFKTSKPTITASAAPNDATNSSVQASPPATLSGIPPKLLTAVSPFIGTKWAEASGIYSISWDEPGKAIKVNFDGIYSRSETVVTNSADGKFWKAISLDLDSGETTERNLKVRPGKFQFISTGYEFDCKPAKAGGAACNLRNLADSSTLSAVFGFVNDEYVKNLMASWPARFPNKQAGSFHPVLGAIADLARNQYVSLKLENGAFKTSEGFGDPKPEIGANGGSYNVIYIRGAEPVLLSGAKDLVGSVANPNNSNPGDQTPYRMSTNSAGQTSICWTEFESIGQECEHWRTSLDGKYALKRDKQGTSYFVKKQDSAKLPASLGVFVKLNNRIFDRGNSATINYTVSPDYVNIFRQSSSGYFGGSNYSSEDFFPKQGKFNNKTLAEARFSFDANSYTIGDSKYTLLEHEIVYRNSEGREFHWPETTPGLAVLGQHDNWAREEYRVTLREYRRIQREEARSQARNAAMWAKTLGELGTALAGGTTSNNAFLRPTTPAEWASRLGVSSQGSSPATSVRGYESMGGVSFSAAPQRSPAQQAQWEELERFKMREQLYRGERPTTIAEDTRAKTDAQNRQIASSRTSTSSANDDAGSDESASRQQEEAERKRLADEAARAEKARQDKLAAGEAARKKREADAKARAENEPVEWKEGVVVCEPTTSGGRVARCSGPLQTMWGTVSLDTPTGKVELGQACGINKDQVRELGTTGRYVFFGCGYGIHPSPKMRSVPLHGDPAEKMGIGYVPNRRTYKCSSKQTDICTNYWIG